MLEYLLEADPGTYLNIWELIARLIRPSPNNLVHSLSGDA